MTIQHESLPWVVSAFCGSGKTILQIYLAAHDMLRSRTVQRRQLLVVPQAHIADGFASPVTIKVSGREYKWMIGENNFCDHDSANIIRDLTTWMLTPQLAGPEGSEILTGFAIATHQAIAMVWNRLSDEEKRQALDNLSLRIDEAHHIKGVFDNFDDDFTKGEKTAIEEEATALGRICLFAINENLDTTKIHLTTATPYRGDCGIWLTPKVRKQFAAYYLPWIDHWRSLKIGSFEVIYEAYDTDPVDLVIDRILMEPNERHLVIVPPTRARWRKDGPEVDRLFQRLNELRAAGKFDGEVLDLVTKETQEQNKAALLSEPKHGNDGEPRFRVVVTCMLGREGTDWVPCSRLHNTSCEESITLAVQTFGRPFRMFIKKVRDPHTGEVHGISLKESVRIFNFVQRFAEPGDGVTKKELLANRTNAILVCTQWDEMCYPFLVTTTPSGKDPLSIEPERVGYQQLLGSRSASVLRDVFEEVECVEIRDKKRIYAIVDVVLDKHKIKGKNRAAVTDALYAEVRRRQMTAEERSEMHTKLLMRSPLLKGIDVNVFLGFGLDEEIEQKLDRRGIYFKGKYDEAYFESIRSVIRGTRLDFYTMLDAYKRLKGVPVENDLEELALSASAA